jgi:hypothetical protein
MTADTTRLDAASSISPEQLGRWLDLARRIGPAGPQLTSLVVHLTDCPSRDTVAAAREAARLAARTAFWDVQAMAAALATELEAVLDASARPASAAPEPPAVREMA